MIDETGFGGSEAGKKGGQARADSLNGSQRSEIARIAAQARWRKSKASERIVKATHMGDIPIGTASIKCAVLEDGTRVLTQEGFFRAIGRSPRPAGGRGSVVEEMAPFLNYRNLKPFIDKALVDSTKPFTVELPTGKLAHAYSADVLPKVCDVYLRARDAGVLFKSQEHFAKACDLVIRSLAHVGIVALVDEATGYQKDRARDALAKILEAFVAKELQKWVGTFRLDYYEQMFRLWKVRYDRNKPTMKRPQFFGVLTNNIVYERLAPGLLHELRKKNPPNEKGQRSNKHFQHLTTDIGHPKLLEHLAAVTALMRASPSKETFMKMLDTSLPKYKPAPLFMGEHPDEPQASNPPQSSP